MPTEGSRTGWRRRRTAGPVRLSARSRGELVDIDPGTFSLASVLAFFYLVVFGSMVAFGAYSWLLRTTHPTVISTYAYVNPVIAVFLGWLLADEPVDARTIVASVLILGAVVVVLERRGQKGSELAVASPPEACSLDADAVRR